MLDVDEFIRDGFARLAGAARRETADAARDLLWRQIGLSPDEPENWNAPVKWAADLTGHGPFGEISRSPRLADALDLVCGRGGWLPRGALGNIPVRFPAQPPAEDRGWHIDANTPAPDGSWAISGRPHTLLLLTLLSDVGPDDAPTRIRIGSHRRVAAALGDRRSSFEDSAPLVDEASERCPVGYATGEPGDMYLVHPFTVHAADEHRGITPRFMAQAPVMLTRPLTPGTESALARVWD
ncbi:mitomycin antibiotics/polyketide fumonisin biosynthesis protein [Mycobacterium manitobense]|uniref:Mitomycin antibiotics/polyketide fumonisin biosynthesis protein n=1 Tax=[Mycobacterium] manitobense TaxID=190147 RepID=A0A9X2YCE8_9MYCO|nr:mitomycin antibiotics/polyketide fumonisin biosynthesis protein [[Mycobacterium] manitobense]MCV7172012.1 mitomycin antibiotics/polyketide fumonisin biosynthesis protein [[Mycobacterium] manitobense]